MRILTVLFLILLSPLVPVSGEPLSENAFFQAILGHWEGEGALVDADGKETAVAEAWSGEFSADGVFVIRGKRTWNAEENGFSWEFFTHNDLIEGVMAMEKFPDLKPRFEATVLEEGRSIRIQVPLTDATLSIVNTLSEDGNTLVGTVELENAAGEKTLTGRMTHRKKNR